MPSFDVISKINYQEFDNALANCLREISNRYDFKGLYILIERKDKYHFKMHISKPIKVNSNKTTEDITLFLNTVLEKMILKNVDQWIWTHDRWKK